MPQNTYNLSVDIHSSADDARKAISDVLELLGRLPKSVDIPVRVTAPPSAPTLPQPSAPTLPQPQGSPASAPSGGGAPGGGASGQAASAVSAAIGHSAAAAIAALRRTGEEAARSVAATIRAALSSAPTLPQPSAPTLPQPQGSPASAPSGGGAPGGGARGGAGARLLATAKAVAGKVVSAFKGAFGAVAGIVKGAFGTVSKALSMAGAAASVAFGAVLAAAKTAFGAVAGIVKGVFGAVVGIVKGAFGAVAGIVKGAVSVIALPFKALFAGIERLSQLTVVAFGAVKTVAGVVKSAVAAIQPAAEFEKYRMQLKVLLKDTDKANDRFRKLKDYARDTNFNPDEVVKAGAAMQAFGLWTDNGMRRLRLAGDAANAFGMSLEDVVHSLNYLATGRGGEAMESLGRMGITREKLQPYGVNFKKSGEMATSPKKAVKAVFSYIQQNYGGMTAKMGSTWSGAVAQMGGALKDALAEAFEGTLPHMTELVNDITKAIGSTGKMLKNLNLEQYFAGPIAAIKGMVDIFADLADPDLREQGIEEIKGLWDGLKLTLSAAWDGLARIGGSLIDALGIVLTGVWDSIVDSVGKMRETGAWGAVFSSLGKILEHTFRAGAELFKGVLDTFAPRFMSDLKVLWDTIAGAIPGLGDAVTGERRRREEADEIVRNRRLIKADLDGEYKPIYDDVKKYAAEHKKAYTTAPSMMGTVWSPGHTEYRDWTENEIQEEAQRRYWETDKGKEWLVGGGYREAYDKYMGFDGASSAARAEEHFAAMAGAGRDAVSEAAKAIAAAGGGADLSKAKGGFANAVTLIADTSKEVVAELSTTFSQGVWDPLARKGNGGIRRKLAARQGDLKAFDDAHRDEVNRLELEGYGGRDGGGRLRYRQGLAGTDAERARARLAQIRKERKEISDDVKRLSTMSRASYSGKGSLLTQGDYKAAVSARSDAEKAFADSHEDEYRKLYAKGYEMENGRMVKRKGTDASKARRGLKELKARQEAAGRAAYDTSLSRAQVDAARNARGDRMTRGEIQQEQGAAGQAAQAAPQGEAADPLLGPVRQTADCTARTSSFVDGIRKKVDSMEASMARLVDILGADVPATATA